LNPHETVNMPVFFRIEPEIVDDPALDKVSDITLCYTFFKSKRQLTSEEKAILAAEREKVDLASLPVETTPATIQTVAAKEKEVQ